MWFIRWIGFSCWFTLVLSPLACSDDDSETPQGDVQNDVIEEVIDDPGEVTSDALWDVVVNLDVSGDITPVNLSDLQRTTFESQDAVRLTRVVEEVALELPWNYHYNFIGSDGFNPLVERLENDLAPLPVYGELEQGYLYWDEGSLRVGFEEALGFPRSLAVRGMAGGTIELIEIDPAGFVVAAGEVRTFVDVTELSTVDVVDYRHPEDGAQPMVPIADVFTAGGVTDPENYAYRMTGNDGFSNTDDNLMPYENSQHGYIDPTNRRLILEEEWDTEICCWRVRDIVMIVGIPVE